MSASKKARVQQQRSELQILMTALWNMSTLTPDDRTALDTTVEHVRNGEYGWALDYFRDYFSEFVRLRIDFDQTIDFDRIAALLQARAVSAASAPESKNPAVSAVPAAKPKKPKKPVASAAAPTAAKPKKPKKPVASAAAAAAAPAAAAPAAPVTTPEHGPFDMNGYYPLFNTIEGAKEAGDGTFHEHVINGIVYYMPNGVEHYHGDYTGHSDSESGSDSDHGDDDDLTSELIPQEEKKDEEDFADMRQRYQSALDCLHAFGGHRYFNNDGANLTALRKYEKRMDAILKKAIKAVQATQKKIDALGGNAESDSVRQLEAQLQEEKKDMYVASDNATLDPTLRFTPESAKLSDNALFMDRAFDQIHIRTWAYGAAVLQMPVGTIFEVAYKNEDTGALEWYFARITVPNLRRGCLGIEFVKRVGNLDAYKYKKIQDGKDYELSLVDDTFRYVHRRDAAFDKAEEETLNQGAAALDQKEEDTPVDAADDAAFDVGAYVEYESAGSLVRGEIARKRRKETASVHFPYEYTLKGQDIWVGGEHLHAVLDPYTVGQKVFWNGKIRTIRTIQPATSSADGVAVFKDGESASFHELGESELRRQDDSAASREAKSAEHDVSLDLKATYTCEHENQQHTVTIVRAPYHVYTSEDWEKLKVEKDLPEDLRQPEKVDVKDVFTGNTFSVWAADISPLKDTSNVPTDDDSEWDSE